MTHPALLSALAACIALAPAAQAQVTLAPDGPALRPLPPKGGYYADERKPLPPEVLTRQPRGI